MNWVNHNGFKIIKRGRSFVIFIYNNQGWIEVFKQYNVYNVEDAKLLIDHHVQKIENNA